MQKWQRVLASGIPDLNFSTIFYSRKKHVWRQIKQFRKKNISQLLINFDRWTFIARPKRFTQDPWQRRQQQHSKEELTQRWIWVQIQSRKLLGWLSLAIVKVKQFCFFPFFILSNPGNCRGSFVSTALLRCGTQTNFAHPLDEVKNGVGTFFDFWLLATCPDSRHRHNEFAIFSHSSSFLLSRSNWQNGQWHFISLAFFYSSALNQLSTSSFAAK